ncbi:MAG: ATP-binding cassette subfamily F protein uup, partial [Myxococcota bacterium]
LKAARGGASFEMGEGRRLGKTILEFVNVTKGFDGPPLIEDFSLIVRKRERIGLIGANGCGKTTLMRLVADQLEPDEGTVVRGKNTVIAYFDQHRSALDLELSVRETVCPDGQDVFVGGKPMHYASWLAKFGFHTEQHRMKVAKLSGGERNRLALARFLQTDANLMIFDEPTNDLDLMTMHVLEEALNAFPGVVLVVSHDRYFLNRVATAILAFERLPDEATTISVIQGDYTTYTRLRKDALDLARAEASARNKAGRSKQKGKGAAKAAKPVKPATPKGLTHSETLELATLEPAIELAEAALAKTETALADPDLWADGSDTARGLQAERDTHKASVKQLYARWEDLAARKA